MPNFPKQRLAIYSLKKNAKLLSKLSFMNPLFVVKKVLLYSKSLELRQWFLSEMMIMMSAL